MLRKYWYYFLLLFLYILIVIYNNRGLFFLPFDEAYWKDRYEHSQWKLPLSVRTIGDDGLYLYEGYRLIKGGDPTLLNAEVPPLGKYLIGTSILVFTNGYWFGLLTTLGVVVMVFLLSRSIGLSYFYSLLASSLTLFDPLITSQMNVTMLDSLQSFFLLATLYFARSNPALSGLTLGFFAESKAPLFVPIVIVALLPHLIKNKKIFFTFGFAALLGYLAPYIPYFFQGHSIIEWLKVQKWMLSFYRDSNLSPTFGSAITSLLIGKYQNIFDKSWVSIAEYNVSWPIITLLGSLGLLKLKKIITTNTLLLLAALCIIPFWTRYLVLVLPLLIIGFVFFVTKIPSKKTQTILLLVCIVFQLFGSSKILFPTPENTIKEFTHEWRYGFFHDMYEALSQKAKNQLNRNEFYQIGMNIFYDAQIEAIGISKDPIQWSRFASPQHIPITITYMTRELGTFKHDTTLVISKENNRWHIDWKWENLLPSLTPHSKLETIIEPARRGSIIGSDKKPISYDFESMQISVIPNNVRHDQEERLYKLLEELSGGKTAAVAFHQRAVGNSLGFKPIPMIIASAPINTYFIKELSNISGVLIQPHIGRFIGTSSITTIGSLKNAYYFECCSRLYSATTYTGNDGVELTKNELLQGINGGTLIMKDAYGNTIQTLISKMKKDGQDVQP